eukprot:8504281-Ditylum_brightwellii.AAC.1
MLNLKGPRYILGNTYIDIYYKGVDFLTGTVKQDTKKEYLNCVHSILKVDLTGNSMMTATCAYAVPVMRYMFGILQWTQSKSQQLDKKTRKLLTMHGFLHPKSSMHRLYLHSSMGGCGLT